MKQFLLILLCVLYTNINSQTDIPDKDMWVTNATVNAIAVDGDYTYIGGNFTIVGPNTGNGAKITTTSTTPNLNFPKVNNTISVAVSDGSGGWYIGGSFTKVGNVDINRIAHIFSDGTVNETWNPNASSTVNTIAINGNDIYAGGAFTTIGGETRNRIAKLNNTTGAADGTWNPDASATVSTIAINGNDIYAGGAFTTIGGETRNRIAKLNNTNGAADGTWNPNAISTVNTIAISGSDIYIGGAFITIGGGSLQRSLALFTDRVLPVELTSFIAKLINNKVNLNWQTATEVDNYGFQVQRTKDKVQSKKENESEWEEIGFVNGHGNNNSVKDYSFIDNLALNLNQKIYYRLKQIDNDGAFEYSSVIEVELNNIPTEFSLEQNYPNPFNPSTAVSYQLAVDSRVTLKVYDILGKEITTLVNEVKEAGNHQVNFSAENLTSGVYFYSINASAINGEKNFSSVKKMLLLK